MMNGQRYDNMPASWTGTQREWDREIARFKQLLIDTHQAHRGLRKVVLEDDGPPKLQPSSR
eukprot:11502510-Karenia_brevis.AAC.1